MVDDLLEALRGAFYADATPEQWHLDRFFLKIHVVTWPAFWLNKRGVTLRPERYKAILLGVFNEVKRHGATGEVKHWPRYLTHCVQQHFKHHGEEYYEEGKSLRASLEIALGKVEAARRTADPVQAIGQAHDVLRTRRRQAKKAPDCQQTFDL